MIFILEEIPPTTPSHAVPSSRITSPKLRPIPWDRLIPKKFKNGKNETSLELEFIKNVNIYQRDELEDLDHDCAHRMATEMVKRFPKAFEVRLPAGDYVNDGVQALATRVYQNGRSKNKIQGKRSTKTESPPAKRLAEGKLDEYGCVAYSVPYPEDETDATQEEKKAALIRDAMENKLESAVVAELLQKTYASQRSLINGRKNNLTVGEIVKDHYPHLQKLQHFCNHSSTLLGKNVVEVWTRTLNDSGRILHKFFDLESYSKKDKKNCPSFVAENLKILNEIKQSQSLLGSEEPAMIGIFSMLSNFFSESELYFILVSIHFIVKSRFIVLIFQYEII